jgi:hypothetical protein
MVTRGKLLFMKANFFFTYSSAVLHYLNYQTKLNIFQEDKILIQMVNLQSARKWSTIACSVPGRSPRQCQER